MDIILDTVFNNPRLPVVARTGFRDDFNLPAGSLLTKTLDGKTWETYGMASSPVLPWTIDADGHVQGKDRSAFAVADGLSHDGTLTATVGKAPTSADLRSGIVMRYVDVSTFLGVFQNPSGILTFYERGTAGTITSVGLGASMTPGDVITMSLSGSLVEVKINGATVHAGSISTVHESSRHGMISWTASSDGAWDEIVFVAPS